MICCAFVFAAMMLPGDADLAPLKKLLMKLMMGNNLYDSRDQALFVVEAIIENVVVVLE